MGMTHKSGILKQRNLYLLLTLLTLFFSPLSSFEPHSTSPVTIELIHQEKTIQPGHPFWVAINVNMEGDWNSYWKNPGDTGAPINVTWDLPPGYSIDAMKWPAPTRYSENDLITYGYENSVVLLAQITPPHQVLGDTATLKAHVRWVACSGEECQPGSADASVELPIRPEQPEKHATHHKAIQQAISQLPEKLEDASLTVNTDSIEIHLPPNLKPTTASFCPENNEMIDARQDASLNQKEGHFAVVLKRGTGTELKGILVLSDGSKTSTFEISLPIQDPNEISMADPLNPSFDLETTESQFSTFWVAFGLAFIGGMILNLMPCVLPVVSFKIMSFMKMAGQSRSETFKHGLAYTFGVLTSFWLLASVLLVLQAYGNSVGWGFQLQNPGFISILVAIIFTFGLSLLGVFEMGTSLTSFAGKAQGKAKEGLTSSMMSGVLATIVATPCTGPFLGTAVGIATTLAAPLALLVFTSLALGMAFPYLLLSAYPTLLKFMPKPGNWMVTFKEITGFFMMATVLWLIWVFNSQTNSIALMLMLSALLLFAIGSWVFGKWGTPVKTKKVRLIGYAAAALFFVLGGYALVQANTTNVVVSEEIAQTESWEKFHPSRVDELRAQGTPVFVDFTAKWCLTCQLNHTVLVSDDVEGLFNDRGIVRMKADWTSHDDMITAELRKFGRNSVPLYVYYPADPTAAPVILPQMLTASSVISTINTSDEVIAERP